MIDLTEPRLDVLERCIEAGADGYTPKGSEWTIAYALRDRRLVEIKPKKPADTPRFLATRMGKSLLNIRRMA